MNNVIQMHPTLVAVGAGQCPWCREENTVTAQEAEDGRMECGYCFNPATVTAAPEHGWFLLERADPQEGAWE